MVVGRCEPCSNVNNTKATDEFALSCGYVYTRHQTNQTWGVSFLERRDGSGVYVARFTNERGYDARPWHRCQTSAYCAHLIPLRVVLKKTVVGPHVCDISDFLSQLSSSDFAVPACFGIIRVGQSRTPSHGIIQADCSIYHFSYTRVNRARGIIPAGRRPGIAYFSLRTSC